MNKIFLLLFFSFVVFCQEYQEKINFYGYKKNYDSLLKGDVKKPSGQIFYDISDDYHVVVGDTIIAPSDESLKINFTDGSMVELYPNSSLYIKSLEELYNEKEKSLKIFIQMQVLKGKVKGEFLGEKDYVYQIYDSSDALIKTITSNKKIWVEDDKVNYSISIPYPPRESDKLVLKNYFAKIDIDSLADASAYRFDGSQYFMDKSYKFSIGDTVQTSANKEANLDFPSSSKIIMSPDSSITFYNLKRKDDIIKTTIRINKGNIRFDLGANSKDIYEVIDSKGKKIFDIDKNLDVGYNDKNELFLQSVEDDFDKSSDKSFYEYKGKKLKNYMGYDKNEEVKEFDQNYLDTNFYMLNFISRQEVPDYPKTLSIYPKYIRNQTLQYPYDLVSYLIYSFPRDALLNNFYMYERSKITEIKKQGGFLKKHSKDNNIFFTLPEPYRGMEKSDFKDLKYYEPQLSYLSNMKNKVYPKKEKSSSNFVRSFTSFKYVLGYFNKYINSSFYYMPYISHRGFEMQFSIPLNFSYNTNNKNLSNPLKEWNFGKDSPDEDKTRDIVHDIVSKIYFMRYYSPYHPFFLEYGKLSDVTVMDGFFISNYNNSPNIFLNKTTGLRIGFNSKHYIFDTMINDLSYPNVSSIAFGHKFDTIYPVEVLSSMIFNFNNAKKYVVKSKDIDTLDFDDSFLAGIGVQLNFPVLWQRYKEQLYISGDFGFMFTLKGQKKYEEDQKHEFNKLYQANKIGFQLGVNYHRRSNLAVKFAMFFSRGAFYPGFVNELYEKTGFLVEQDYINEKTNDLTNASNFGFSIKYSHMLYTNVFIKLAYSMPLRYNKGKMSVLDDTFSFAIESSPYAMETKTSQFVLGFKYASSGFIKYLSKHPADLTSGKASLLGYFSASYKDYFKITLFAGLDNTFSKDMKYNLSKDGANINIEAHPVAGIVFELFTFEPTWFYSNRRKNSDKYLDSVFH